MQQIGKFSLKNEGGFLVKLQFKYLNDLGNWIHVDGTDSYPNPQSKTADPSDFGVPDGSLVCIYAFVVWGADNTGDQVFQYQKGNKYTANYVITGATLTNTLALVNIS